MTLKMGGRKDEKHRRMFIQDEEIVIIREEGERRSRGK